MIYKEWTFESIFHCHIIDLNDADLRLRRGSFDFVYNTPKIQCYYTRSEEWNDFRNCDIIC